MREIVEEAMKKYTEADQMEKIKMQLSGALSSDVFKQAHELAVIEKIEQLVQVITLDGSIEIVYEKNEENEKKLNILFPLCKYSVNITGDSLCAIVVDVLKVLTGKI